MCSFFMKICACALFMDAMAMNAWAQDTLTRIPNSESVAALAPEIESGDSLRISRAVEQIRVWCANHRVPWALRHEWLPALFIARRYDDVASLSLDGLLGTSDVPTIEPLME
jgi:hypothetical protein